MQLHLFAELGILIGTATAVAFAMRLLKQPLIIGHIITGLLVGPFVLDLIRSTETFALFSEIGIAILLFTVGLNLSPDVIRKFGKVALITGIGQVVFTSLVGFFICLALGLTPIASFYVSVALAFSSTIIILKLITDKGDIDALYAKIAIGFLLVQDIIAILLLFTIPLISAGDSSWLGILALFGKGIGLILAAYFGAHLVMPKLNRFLSQSQELLFLFALAWGIGVAALFREFGFSLESGALIAGVALSTIPSRMEISARLTPLRDFFIILFFILLGSQMQLDGITANMSTAAILSVLVLVGNPLILMAMMGWMGYRKKTSLQTGFTVAQISEFSLILVAMGVKQGQISQDVLSLVTLVGLVTISGSTYLVLYSDRIYSWLSPYLGIFQRKDIKEHRVKKRAPEIILFGCNRLGTDFLAAFRKLEKNFMVVDHNPETVEQMEKDGLQVEYGDAGDLDFLQGLDLSRLKLAVSTIPDTNTNLLINRAVKSARPEAIVIVVAYRVQEALSHYDQGVDYVILPHFLGSQHASDLVVQYRTNPKKYHSLKAKHMEYLNLRIAIGHDHPSRSGD